MRYKILKDDIEVNIIVASEEFVIRYCTENGYTYEEDPVPEVPTPVVPDEPVPDDSDIEQAIWDSMAQAYDEGFAEGVQQA